MLLPVVVIYPDCTFEKILQEEIMTHLRESTVLVVSME